MDYALLLTVWLAWCALHSALISNSLIGFLQKRRPQLLAYHRIGYNLVAVATLVPVLAYTFSLRSPPWFTWQGPLRPAQLLIAAAAVALFIAGGRRYDTLQFLGLRQARGETDACKALTDTCRLETSGVLGLVRHPWYTGGILIVWVRPLDLSTLLTNLVITGYLIIGAHLEERRLRKVFGREYREYQNRVSMFAPLKWLGQRLRS